jgi:lipopolysaccharide/colanic/teichoic acid biosynthesis glycosyltransferase
MQPAYASSRRAARKVRDGAMAALCRQVTKRLLDVAGSVVILLLVSPLMFAIAAAIRLTSPGPAFFRQTRVGLHGRHFVILKFRTMRADSSDKVHREYVRRMLSGEADCLDGLYKLDRDSRITGVGALLRRFSLDELPQLLNVLRGDMSLVGPRPALPWELEMFPESARPRFDVAPGLTGLWQVSGRNRLTMLEGLELDVQYVNRHTIWTDLMILLRTIPALMRGEAR